MGETDQPDTRNLNDKYLYYLDGSNNNFGNSAIVVIVFSRMAGVGGDELMADVDGKRNFDGRRENESGED